MWRDEGLAGVDAESRVPTPGVEGSGVGGRVEAGGTRAILPGQMGWRHGLSGGSRDVGLPYSSSLELLLFPTALLAALALDGGIIIDNTINIVQSTHLAMMDDGLHCTLTIGPSSP